MTGPELGGFERCFWRSENGRLYLVRGLDGGRVIEEIGLGRVVYGSWWFSERLFVKVVKESTSATGAWLVANAALISLAGGGARFKCSMGPT